MYITIFAVKWGRGGSVVKALGYCLELFKYQCCHFWVLVLSPQTAQYLVSIVSCFEKNHQPFKQFKKKYIYIALIHLKHNKYLHLSQLHF